MSCSTQPLVTPAQLDMIDTLPLKEPFGELQNRWACLALSMELDFLGGDLNRQKFSLLYNHAYQMTIEKHGALIYKKFSDLLDHRVSRIIEKLRSFKQNPMFLTVLEADFSTYMKDVKRTSEYLMYTERVQSTKGYPTFLALANAKFRTVFEEPDLMNRTTHFLMEAMSGLRRKEANGTVKAVLDILDQISNRDRDLYNSIFALQFVKESFLYLTHFCDVLLTTQSVSEFLTMSAILNRDEVTVFEPIIGPEAMRSYNEIIIYSLHDYALNKIINHPVDGINTLPEPDLLKRILDYAAVSCSGSREAELALQHAIRTKALDRGRFTSIFDEYLNSMYYSNDDFCQKYHRIRRFVFEGTHWAAPLEGEEAVNCPLMEEDRNNNEIAAENVPVDEDVDLDDAEEDEEFVVVQRRRPVIPDEIEIIYFEDDDDEEDEEAEEENDESSELEDAIHNLRF